MRMRIRGIIPHDPRTGTQRPRVFPALALVACLLAGCSSRVDDVTAAITPSASPATSPSTTAGVVLAPRQDPAISIETPLHDGEVSSPVSVTGTADVAGREVTVRVLDRDGSELAAIEIDVDCRHTCPGWVEVSGRTDGGPAVSLVPVVLFPL
jgi:hypothetical protein